MIRVVVVDDESLVRSGFQLVLGAAGDIDVVATAEGATAVGDIERHQPDAVLLDIRMPDVDGLTILRRIQEMPRPPAVAMLTTFDADEYIAAALREGAAGFILKDTDPEQLARYVRALAAGAIVLSPKVTKSVVHGYLGATGGSGAARLTGRLTGREREVLVLVAGGYSNTEIGRHIHLSASTIKDHVSAILGKLEVDSRIQAALIAQRAGLLGDGVP